MKESRYQKGKNAARRGKLGKRGINVDGYAFRYDKNQNKVYEHRQAAEKKLKRKLSSKEFVHHKNSNRRDNSSSNLEAMSQGKHNVTHKAKKGKDAKTK
jgi:hypothetical protein